MHELVFQGVVSLHGGRRGSALGSPSEALTPSHSTTSVPLRRIGRLGLPPAILDTLLPAIWWELHGTCGCCRAACSWLESLCFLGAEEGRWGVALAGTTLWVLSPSSESFPWKRPEGYGRWDHAGPLRPCGGK